MSIDADATDAAYTETSVFIYTAGFMVSEWLTPQLG